MYYFSCIVDFIASLIIGPLVISNDKPKAMNVYRGKTELKINGEYKDSIFIPTDNIVVFKNK